MGTSALPSLPAAQTGVRKPRKPQQPGLQLPNQGGTANQGLTTSSSGSTGVTRPIAPTDRTNPEPQPPASSAPTFAQQQAAGQARPAPPTTGHLDPGASQPGTPGTPTSIAPPGGLPTSQQDPGIQSSLRDSVAKQLQTPSRYDTATFNAIRDPAVADLQAQYAKIRDTTDTDLARRGLSASTFGGNELYDVDAAQSRDLANLNSTLLTNAANTQAADTTAAQTGAQNYQNSALAQQLGLGNLGLQQGALTGSYNGAPTAQASQFGQTLAQQLGIATMQDTTQNRQVDAEAALSQNNLLIQVAQLLGLGGYLPKPGSTTTTPTGTGGSGGGVTGGTGGPSTGTPGTGGTTGGGTGGTGDPGNSGGGQTLLPDNTFRPQVGGPTYGGLTGSNGPGFVNSTGGDDLLEKIRQMLKQSSGPATTNTTTPTTSTNPTGSTTPASNPNGIYTGNSTPGNTGAQNYTANTNPTDNRGPLSVNVSQTGTDPMAQYARGEITYQQLQEAMGKINSTNGSWGFTPDAMSKYTDAQLQQSLGTQYQSLLAANHGNAAAAAPLFLQALMSQGADPRAIAAFKAMTGLH